jgi:3-dehydroquinate dehydratase-2
MAKKPNKDNRLPLYLLNGPNLNTLGTREPEIYGTTTLAEIEAMAAAEAKRHGYRLVARQTNSEGGLVDLVQEARTQASAVILNAAAFTHTSVALYDALKMLKCPIIELHISNPHQRESFRHTSYVGMAATGTILGIGFYGYVLAVDAAVHLVEKGKHQAKGKGGK